MIKTNKYSPVFYIWTVIVIVLTVGFGGTYLLTGSVYLYADFCHQMLPFVYETKRMLASGAPFWSWNTYFGDNFLGAYAYYTAYNPFTWFNCLFPYKLIPLGFIITLYLKFLVCGWLASIYFRKLGFENRLIVVGSLLYALSSFVICSILYYMFLEPIMVFPLLLYFIERYIAGEKYRYSGLIIAVAIVTLANYYFAAGTFIGASIYFLLRLGAKRLSLKEYLLTTLKALGCVILGMLLVSFMLCPVLYQLSGSSRQTIDTDCFKLCAIADRIFGLLYPKSYEGPYNYIYLENFWRSNTANVAIFGILPTILLFFKKSHCWLKWYIAILILIYVTPLNGIFVLFTDGYYSRWAYILTLALITGTLYYFKDYGNPKKYQIVLYVLFFLSLYLIFAALSIKWQIDINNPEKCILRIVAHALVIILNFAGLIWVCGAPFDGKKWIKRFLVSITICVSVQLQFYLLYCMTTSPLSHDYMLNLAVYFSGDDIIEEKREPFRYRTDYAVDSMNILTNNFAVVFNSPSVETYHSVPNPKMQLYFKMEGDEIGRAIAPTKHPVTFDALLSVKDVVNFNDGNCSLPEATKYSRFKSAKGLFYQYDFNYYIPMGFVYDKYQIEDELLKFVDEGAGEDTPLSMLHALTIKSEDEDNLSKYMVKSDFGDNLSLDSICGERREAVCESLEGDSKGFRAKVNVDRASVLFFSVLADPGFTATVDGKKTKIYEVNLGMSAIVVPEGSHFIRFDFWPQGLTLGIFISIVSMIVVTCIYFLERNRHL